jgi:WD40 repeat protein
LSLKGHTRGLTSVAFAPDGQAALTAARDGLTILWPAAAAAGKQQVQGSLPVQLPQAAR